MREIQIRNPFGEHPYLQAFGEALRRQDLAESTIRSYGYDVREFLPWFIGARGASAALEKIEGVDVYRYREHLLDHRRLRPSTVNRRSKRHRPMGLKGGEVHVLLRAAGVSTHGLATRNYALVQFLLQTGLRVGETSALVVEELTLRDRSGRVQVRGAKGGKQREVPINASARRALRRYLDSRGELDPGDPVFESSRRQPMSVRSIQHTVSSLARRAGLDRIPVSAHTLRHTFALDYLRRNPGKLVELASLLGHDSLDTTALYTRPSMEELAQTLERSGRDE